MTKKGEAKPASKDIWFEAIMHGRGWGLPVKWQGWVALLGLVGLGLAPFLYLSIWYKGDTYCQSIVAQNIAVACDPHAQTSMYLLAAVFWLSASFLLLFHIITIKGEPATWRRLSKAKHAKKS
jgi:hypothetical protein